MIVSYSTTNGTVKKSKIKTLIENRLRCINCILFFIIVALFMGLVIVLRERVNDPNVCLTTACIESASDVIKYMDTTVDPCTNFYTFACGNYMKDVVIPDDKSYENHFSTATDNVFEQLQLIFEEGFTYKAQPYKLLKDVYDLCMDTKTIEETSLQRAKQLLISLGGWPILQGSKWNQSNFTWINLVYKLRKLGFKYDYFFSVNIEPDDKNSSQRVLTLDQNVIKPKDLPNHNHHSNITTELYNYLLQVVKVFGANMTLVDKDIKDVIQLEVNLSKIQIPEQDRRNTSRLYNKMSVRELQFRFPGINWMEFITTMVNLPKFNISYKDTIVVKVPTYFTELETLLKKTSKRTQANYILTKAVTSLIPFLTEELRIIQWEFNQFFTSTISDGTRWKECIKVALRNVGLPLHSLYIRKHFNHTIKDQVQLLVSDIRNEFQHTLETTEWLDNSTKKNALEKLNALLIQIGPPEELLNDELITKFYSNLTITTKHYVDAILQTNLFHENRKFSNLQKTVNKGDWTEYVASTSVNAFYVYSENSIKIPAAILHNVFFDSNRPQYMNFATLGNIVGHEIIHGFDNKGSHYDQDGNVNNWWSNQSRREFLERIQCITEQYRNYNDPLLNVTTNRIITQDENIADNGGIKQSYLAYRKWVKRNKPETQLPGLYYTPQQMFWISSAQLWCYKSRVEGLKGMIKVDSHSLSEHRVIGTFSNLINFSNDFNCPIDSPMNPQNKCTVW